MAPIITKIGRIPHDPLIQNLINKEYLEREDWDPRLQALIPPNMWYFDPEDEKTWYVDTPTQFIERLGKRSRFVIVVRWWTEIDPRGIKRLLRRNGWYRGNEIRIYDRERGAWLEGKDRKAFINEKLLPRLKRVLGVKKLKGVPIRRYRFNFACQYPGGYLRDRDAHHQNMNNKTASERIRPDLKGMYDDWLLATDDRCWNILPRTPEKHNKEHNKLGDTRFIFYRNLDQENEYYQWNQEIGWEPNKNCRAKPPPTERWHTFE